MPAIHVFASVILEGVDVALQREDALRALAGHDDLV